MPRQRARLAKFDGDKRDIQVLPFLILAGDHDVKVAALGGDVHLGNALDQLAHGLAQALLVLGEDVVVQQALPTRDAVRLQVALLHTWKQ